MILLIDNYDSFSYNLVQLLGAQGEEVTVVRNDQVSVTEVAALAPRAIVVSPGPGKPEDAGICLDLIKSFGDKLPILGICLGHQAICQAYGGEITYADRVRHGVATTIHIAGGSPLFKGLPPLIQGARYHSLVARRESLPDELLIIAEDDQGQVMGVKHRDHPVYGIQFHPESILTLEGGRILENFVKGVMR